VTVNLQPAAEVDVAAEDDDDDEDDDGVEEQTPASTPPLDDDVHEMGSSSRDTDRPNTVAMLSSTDADACV
jgi:hypothetical protein